ncbi:inner centromere protein-like [Chenopodium quinoa]|uniref:inner centromere protein-like n=1 Tax=Chenopodium quinoa TaxID=63459 RepID=UPI000B795213|nr:inner centromere protein-like [Chenopodium quinoa]
MARIKRTTRQCSSDGVFFHSDGSTVYSDGSIRVPRSELSEHPDSPSYLPPTPTYYHSPTSSGTPSDGILGEADEEYQPGPSGQAPEESLGEDPAATSRRSPSSDDESASSSSSKNASVTSEEARSNIDSARESPTINKAMEKLSATRKPVVSAARYRSNVLNRAKVTTHTKVDEQKTGGTPKVAPSKSPSKPSNPKVQKTRAGDVCASSKGGRKHIAHRPKKGPDASSLEAEQEISKPNAQRASKGGFKQPTTAVSSAGEKRSLGREEEQKDDVPVQRPTVVQMAKSMMRAVDPDDKASVRGVGTLDLDGILGNLCEAMLRVQGLRLPLKEKSKEETVAKARAESALDRAQFDIAQNEFLTLDMMYSQAEANMQVKKDLDSARLRITSLKKEITTLKEKLEPLQDAKEEAERAMQKVGRLEQRLSNQEHQLKSKFESVADQVREALVKKMMRDYEAIMRDTWAAVQPDSDYQIWKSKFDEASKAFDARLIEEAENAEAEESSGSDSSRESSSGGEEEDQAEEQEKKDEEQPKYDRPAATKEALP